MTCIQSNGEEPYLGCNTRSKVLVDIPVIQSWQQKGTQAAHGDQGSSSLHFAIHKSRLHVHVHDMRRLGRNGAIPQTYRPAHELFQISALLTRVGYCNQDVNCHR